MIKSYSRPPRLVDVSWQTPTWNGLRGELIAGAQTPTIAHVSSQNSPDVSFRWKERVHYIGTLAEYGHRRFTAGFLLRHTFSRMARNSNAGSPFRTDYSSEQASRSVTLYVLSSLYDWRLAVWATHEGYSDRQGGTAFDEVGIEEDLDFRESRRMLHARLHYVPNRGFRAGLDYLVDHRDFQSGADLMNDYLQFSPWSPNGRVALHVGYSFSHRAYVVVGGAYDTGGDPFYDDDRGPVRYDGGFGRVVVAW